MFLFFGSAYAESPLRITIDSGTEKSLSIAIIPFRVINSGGVASLDYTKVIKKDLSLSGRFDVMKDSDLPQRPIKYEDIDFNDWRKLGVENVLFGTIEVTASGEYDIYFSLVDIYRKKQIVRSNALVKQDQIYRAAHQTSDIIFGKLIGFPGVSDTQIVYINVDKSSGKKVYSLMTSDIHGYNTQVLLSSFEPLLSPAWSSDGRSIAYVSFEGNRSAIYIQNVYTGKRELVSSYEGINSAPSFSPDSSKLALTLSKEGSADIYIMDIKTKFLRRITSHPSIDTEPAWSPDGKKLAFTSDRSGRPQIYEIDLSGGVPKRITFDGDYNSKASYSPDRRFIVMVHAVANIYRIGILNLVTGNIKVLTDSRLDESPSFSPNGDMIIYATQTVHNETLLAIISSDGIYNILLNLGKNGLREPVWGPFL